MHRIRTRLLSAWRAPISPDRFRLITAGALVALAAIIVSGAAVRLTGSGMGCPTWPTCEDGSLVPRGATGGHGWIEFLNRLFTGAVSIAVALAVLGSLRRRPYRRDLVLWSWGLVAGVFAQALLGGLVVVLHVAPVAVAGHYLLSAVLVWNAVVLHHKASEPEGLRRPRATPQLLRRSRGLVALAVSVLVSGTLVTGSGPHGGDEAADRLPFAVVTVARVHSLAVWAFLVAVLLVLRAATRGDAGPLRGNGFRSGDPEAIGSACGTHRLGSAAVEPVASRGGADLLGRGRLLLVLVLGQGLLGYVQYAAEVPELLVGGHVLGSVLVWIATLRFHLALTEPIPVADPAPGTLARAVAPVAGR